MMASQRCGNSLIVCIESIHLQNDVGDGLSDARDLLSDSLKVHDTGIEPTYGIEWHRFQPSCPHLYTRFIHTHLEIHDGYIACISWVTIGHMQERHKKCEESCKWCRPKTCILMMKTNELIGVYEEWVGAHSSMATISHCLIENIDDVTQITFAEFASACQEHLQASQKVDGFKKSIPMQRNNEHCNIWQKPESNVCCVYHHSKQRAVRIQNF